METETAVMGWFALTGFVFWACCIIAGGTFVIAIACKNPAVGVFDIIISLLLLQFLFGLNVLAYCPQTWYGWLGLAAAYAGVGVLWSFYRFYVEYRARATEVLEGKDSWLRTNSRFTPEEQIIEWNKHVDYMCQDADSYSWKEAIVSWIAYWPVDALIYTLRDLLAEWATVLYNRFKGLYDVIAVRIKNSIKAKIQQ